MKQISNKAIFVTGGSGFLGAHFIWHLLTKTDFHIVANMRRLSDRQVKAMGAEGSAARGEALEKRRLLQVLAKTAHSYGLAEDRVGVLERLEQASHRISVVLNNMSEADAPLNLRCAGAKGDESLLEVYDITECWHFAGYLTPEKNLTQYDDFANVIMSQNALKLASAMKVSRFFHVSTAYVSGRRDGIIRESLFDFTQPEPSFRNSYERSKYLAEQMACRYSDEYNLPLTVLRPSIVIGPRATKDNGGSQSGFYGVLKAFWRLRGRQLKETIKIPVAQDAGLDLIPVDDFLQEVWAIRQEGLEAHQQVYHLVAGKTVAPDKVVLMAAAQYNSPVEPQVIKDIAQAGISVKALASQLDFYSDYVGSALNFERKRQAPPCLQDNDVLNYITSIQRVYRYGSIDEVFNVSIMKGYHGIKLPVFDTGPIEDIERDVSNQPVKRGKTIIFCHAMAMGAELLIPLASHLKQAGHRLITWETRILPSLTPDFEQDGSTLEVHAKDGLAVIRHLALQEEVLQVAGWSTGAGVAARLGYQLIEKAKRQGGAEPKQLVKPALEQLLLLNGSFMLEGTQLTAFQKNMNMVMPRVAKDRAMTAQLFHLVFAPPHALKWWHVSSKMFRHQANKIMGVNDPRLEHITRQPVRNSETAYRYANQIAGYMSCERWDWLKRIDVPTWVMTCKDDSMTDPSGSYGVHDLIKGSRLKVYDEGDHFKLYQDAQFFEDFLQVITKKEA